MIIVPISGCDGGRIDPRDRGLAYGDGLYETMRWSGGRLPLFDRHRARLAAGAERLRLKLPDLSAFEARLAEHVPANADAIVKLIVTRGLGPRGYALPDRQEPTAVALVEPWLPRPTGDPRGLVVRWCQLRLAVQPALAGIKHLNRLEQVLARAEWHDPTTDEGLLCDPCEHVVCATSANLFAVIDGRLVTPAVDEAGVAGVARGVLIEALDVAIQRVPRASLATASEVFLTNAVHGVRPVARIGDREWGPGPAAWDAATALARAGLPSEMLR